MADGVHTGSAYIRVLPDFRSWNTQTRKQLAANSAEFSKAGAEAGRAYSQSFAKALGNPFAPLKPPDQKAPGAKAGGQFADAFRKRVDAALKALPDAKIGADSSDAEKRIAEIRAELQELGSKQIGVDITDTAALAKLKALEGELDRIGRKSESVRIRVDAKAAVAELVAFRGEVDAATGSTGGLSEALSGASGDMHLLVTTAAAFGPALIPVLGVATAGVIGLGAAAAAAGGAFGLFGAVAASHLSQLNKDLTKVQAANKAANVARATPAGKRTSTQKQAIATAKAMTAEFRKDYGVLAGAQEKLSNAWKAFTSQPFINSTLAKGMALLVQVLPKLNPLLRLGADAVQVLTGALAGWVQSGGLDRVVKGLTALGKNVAIPGFIRILHNLAATFGALAPSAGKFAAGTVGALVRLTGAMAKWATTRGPGEMQSFLAAVRKAAPKVEALFSALASAVPTLVSGLNPLAPVSLAIASALAKLVAGTPPSVITAFAAAFILWKTATTGLDMLKIARETKLWTAAQWLLNVALDANPISLIIIAIGLLVAAIVFLVIKCKPFRDFWIRLWGDVEKIAKSVWHAVENAVLTAVQKIRGFAADIWDAISGVFGRILDGAAKAFGWIPGLGGKLRTADQAFKKWAKSVDSSIRGIHGKTASITFQLGDFVKNGGGVGHPVPHGAARGMLVTGGTAGRDSVLIRAMPGEVIVPTAMVRAGAVDHLRGRIPGFAAGGQVGLGLSQHLAPVPPFISHLTSAIGRQVAQLGQSLIPSGPAGGVGGGVARWAGLIVQVLRMLHQPLGYLGAVEHRMMQESGGNPRAINLWDSNAAAGDPSRGLMQTIGSTFRAYAGPFAGMGIYNPLANIYAGLNYALHRYPGRSLASVMLQPGGYDSGGMLPPGYSTVYNGTGRPEPVLTGAQWDMIAASARGGDGDVYNFGDVGGTIEGRIRASLAAADLVKRNTQRTGRRR